MTGEMSYINPNTGIDSNGEEWPLHLAIAKAVNGTLKPFDNYQGPYIVVGKDLRVGNSPYDMPVQHLGIIRLWVIDDGTIYREDNDQTANFFPYDEMSACEAALSLLEMKG